MKQLWLPYTRKPFHLKGLTITRPKLCEECGYALPTCACYYNDVAIDEDRGK